MSRTVTKSRPDADHYFELVHRFPLRPIRNQDDYATALDIGKSLASRRNLSSGESDYADVLSRLIRDYDEQHSSLRRARATGQKPTPIEMLKYLMEEHGMNSVALGKMVGGSGQASMILSGKRELSKANIRTLAERFKVSPALFI